MGSSGINEEMRQQVLQREEALLSELEKLNLENKKQEHENEELLKQLDEMKTQLQKKDEDFILAEKLRMNTAKKVEMKENVDKLRKERKQKLKKDQDKIDQFQEQQ